MVPLRPNFGTIELALIGTLHGITQFWAHFRMHLDTIGSVIWVKYGSVLVSFWVQSGSVLADLWVQSGSV